MELQLIVMPIISLMAGLLPLLIDSEYSKKKGLTVILGTALVVICLLNVFLSAQSKAENQKDQDKLLGTIRTLQEENKKEQTRLQEYISSLKIELKTSEQKNDQNAEEIKELIRRGFTPESAKIATKADIKQSDAADKQINQKLSSNVPNKPTQKQNIVTVKYYPRNVDSAVIQESLSKLGLKFETEQSPNQNIPTNSIRFGSKVTLEDVKLVAYTLIRAGVELKAIRPFAKPDDPKSSLIQVGADKSLNTRPPLTVEQIRQAPKFPIE
ncbi:MAG: hypothetical protein U7123_09760 [Potamolinea sp.]